jgi:hypothetical protein
MNELELRRGIAARLQATKTSLDATVGKKVSFEEIGFWLAAKMGQSSAYSASSMHRLLTGETDPSVAQLVAFCEVCGERGLHIDPGWLTFGGLSQAAPPSAEVAAAIPLLASKITPAIGQKKRPRDTRCASGIADGQCKSR